LEEINKEWKREVEDKIMNGNTYRSRMMAPKVEGTTTQTVVSKPPIDVLEKV
jgi:hypothetical protein